MIRWSAPGKLVLLGDYAVLEGSRALVAAVDRRAEGQIDAETPPSEVVAAVMETARAAGYEPEPVRIDTAGFLEADGQKLGIGSSAAVAVVTAALATQRGDQETFQIALDGHRAAAGGVGSGIDLAASFHGGVIATRQQPAPVEAFSSRGPGLHMEVVYANESASTSELVRACRAAASWPKWVGVLEGLAEAGIAAWAHGKAEAFLSVVARYGRAMEGMGKDADVPVVTETIHALMKYAEEAGGAAKPSGAGGGDVVLVFGREPGLGARVAERAGARPVELGIDPAGLRQVPT